MTHDADCAAPDLTSLLLDTDTLDGFLHALARTALRMVPAADGCGVTLERQGRSVTVASSGTSAPHLDEAQYGQNDGPCLHALRTGEEVLVTDMLTELRWGPFPAYAAAHGTRASLSLPVAPHSHTAGALNFYAPKPATFDDLDLTALRLL